MPKTADYSKCQIYKIVCKDLTVKDCYVGNTCNWVKRKANHKNTATNENHKEYNYKKAITIRENGGWNNWEMVLIENYPCETDLEARSKEREWLEKLGATMNSMSPLRTPEEHKQYNSKHGIEYHSAHREELNAKCLANNSQKMICSCGKEHNKGGKSNHLKSKNHTEWVKQNETMSAPNTNEPEV